MVAANARQLATRGKALRIQLRVFQRTSSWLTSALLAEASSSSPNDCPAISMSRLLIGNIQTIVYGIIPKVQAEAAT